MVSESDGVLGDYSRAMRYGNSDAAYRIECKHGLAGYPPELVSVGLLAIDQERDPMAAILDYTRTAKDPS